jgi:DNA repair exonuclease SbcCD ATPase subunit
MKKAVLFRMVVFALIYSSSCVRNSSEYKRLEAQRDSLTLVNVRNATEMEEILSLLNEVDDNFKSIKAAENYISVQSNAPGELTPSIRERILADMKFITETLEQNRQKIADLENRLRTSSTQSTQLQQTLGRLRQELDQKTMALVTLNEELEQRNRQISELSASVNNLSKDVQELRMQSQAQQQTIDQQQRELNTVYYCFGTSNELRRQRILVNEELGTDFNRDYFIRVSDLNRLHVIPLLARRGRLVSKHPAGSYEFVNDANRRVELRILDPENFWSLTKYLVVLVNV